MPSRSLLLPLVVRAVTAMHAGTGRGHAQRPAAYRPDEADEDVRDLAALLVEVRRPARGLSLETPERRRAVTTVVAALRTYGGFEARRLRSSHLNQRGTSLPAG